MSDKKNKNKGTQAKKKEECLICMQRMCTVYKLSYRHL